MPTSIDDVALRLGGLHHRQGLLSSAAMSNEDDIVPPACELCGETMTFIQSAPKVGPFPELLTFLCTECGDVRTVEKKDE